MRYSSLLALLFLVLVGCNSEPKREASPEEISVAINFINDIETLRIVEDPIASFKAGAESTAAEAYAFDADNAQIMLEKIKDYGHTVIVVEDYTVVVALGNSQDECRQSASWKACMPYVRGFIKKGELEYQEDFANNLIGSPDKQSRRIYFFNE